MPEKEELPRRQLVFFVRHAESRWNRAQADYAPISMFWENDHGLSEEGRLQAEELRRRVATAGQRAPPEAASNNGCQNMAEAYWLRHFLQPDVVYCSPFTRAICTACIGLQDILPHGKELVLMREAREQKNLMGADSTGIATGEDIPPRIEAELSQLYEAAGEESQRRAVEDFRAVRVDVAGVCEEWWGGLAGDGEEEIHERIAALAARLRATRGSLPGGGGTTVLVGHSLFLRTVFQTFLGEAAHKWDAPWVAESLKVHVLPLCGVVATCFEWDEAGSARIVAAAPVLGTRLTHAEPIPSATSLPLASIQRGPLHITGCVCARKGAECAAM